ncbi:MAG: Gfo/Idh/MocA family oxidoreductase [Solobacterium sp.]|nr:Gfo/Idh/MocA family oxidoreductase [Solobacterium sp.]
MEKKIRFAVLGAGKIAYRFAKSLSASGDCVLTAASGRNPEKISRFADEFHVGRRYVGHDALLADRDIDAVYLALPHGMHREWAVRAMNAGKAVLCEKPAAMNAQEMREIAEVSSERNILFMEAMKPRFVPAMEKILFHAERIGEIREISTSLCNEMPFNGTGTSGTYHTDPAQGGVLLDCGCYCASWLEQFCSGRPELKDVQSVFRNGVNYYTDALLQFGSVSARLECAFDRKKERNAVLRGSRGTIIVHELHRPVKFEVQISGQKTEYYEIPYEVDDFYGEISAFADSLKNGRTSNEKMTPEASVRTAEILDVIQSGMTGN